MLLRPIFAPKLKTDPPNGIGEQKLWRTCCYLDQKSGFFVFWSSPTEIWWRPFFWRSPNFGRKNRFNFGEDLFLGGIPWFWQKDCFNLIQNWRKFGSSSFTVVSSFQKAPSFAKSWLRAWGRHCLENTFWSLGLEAYKSSKIPCPRFEDSTISWFVKNENNQKKFHLNFGFQLDDLFFYHLKFRKQSVVPARWPFLYLENVFLCFWIPPSKLCPWS